MKIHHFILKQCPLSKLNSFDQNFMNLFMKIHHLKQSSLSKSNSFDQNYMKLGHIVKYHEIFFKFDNCLYRTMLSGAMALFYENSPFETMSAL